MDIRLIGRKPLIMAMYGPVRLLSGTSAPVGFASTIAGPQLVTFLPGALRRLTVPFTVSNYKHGQGLRWMEFYPRSAELARAARSGAVALPTV